MNLAESLFGATFAKAKIEQLIETTLPWEVDWELGWDYYDESLELHHMPSDWRMPLDVVQHLLKEGFKIIYVNHEDCWETHYTAKTPNGWRVSYPHKRKDCADTANIWLEEPMPEGWKGTISNVVVFNKESLS